MEYGIFVHCFHTKIRNYAWPLPVFKRKFTALAGTVKQEVGGGKITLDRSTKKYKTKEEKLQNPILHSTES